MKFNTLNEMAYDRSYVIDKCYSLGMQFIKHFKKVYSLGINDKDFKHHCQEMQSWYDTVKNMVLRYNNKRISNDQLINWFFTAGSSTEVLFGNDEAGDIYGELIGELISNKRNNKVVDILTQLLSDNL